MGSTELESVTSSVSGRRANQTALTAHLWFKRRSVELYASYYATFL